MPADLDPLAVLRRTDPATVRPVPDRPPLDELVTLPAGPPAPPPRHRPVVLAAAAVLVVLLAATAIALVAPDEGPGPPDDGPPTPWGPTSPDVVALDVGPDPLPLDPPEPAAARLFALAARVEADRAPLPTGLVAYRRTAGWTSTSTDGTTVRAGEQVEAWTAPGEPRSTRAEVLSLIPSPSGLYDVPLPRASIEPSGPPMVMEDGIWDLPPDVDAVLAELREGWNQSAQDHGRDWATLERATSTLAQPLTGPDRATLLRALAATDLLYRGQVVDRAGRAGIAVSAGSQRSSARWELVVVLDPGSGELLAVEEVGPAGDQLDAGGLPGADDERVATTSTTVLSAAWVPASGDRPE